MNTCPFSTDKSNGVNIQLYCNLAQYSCAYYRWCNTDHCIKMTNGYNTCKLRSEEMAKKKYENIEVKSDVVEVVEEVVKTESEVETKVEPKPKTSKSNCVVTFYKKGSIYFTLDNCGMKHQFDEVKSGTVVKVEYLGKVGQSDFEIVNVSL